jgi:hypothetical protein
MAIVTITELFPGITGFGAKLHCAPAGIPLQESVTTPENADPVGATVRL